MHSPSFDIKPDNYVGEIVSRDYRTADVFRKYGIDFCCGAKRTLQQACDIRGIDTKDLQYELNTVTRTISIPNGLGFKDWPVDFLVDYIQKLHHEYLKQTLPDVINRLENFVEGHKKKYPAISQVQTVFKDIAHLMVAHMEYQERVIFPYVRQINNALKNNADYGSLLVRTLRKPVDKTLLADQEQLRKLMYELRKNTHHYTIPDNVCLTYKVIMQKLQEIDNDLVQHIYLENSILLPKITAIEQELLQPHNL